MVRMNKFIHHIAIIKRSQLFYHSVRLGQSFIVLTRKTEKRQRGEDTRTQLKLYVHGSLLPREGQVIFTRIEC